jgi:hypothetical protein
MVTIEVILEVTIEVSMEVSMEVTEEVIGMVEEVIGMVETGKDNMDNMAKMEALMPVQETIKVEI